MLISYCYSSEKVCLHLFSWPCLQWMSSSFAYLTNVPSYECTITCWCFRWKERFSGLWKCPIYRVAIFVIVPKGLTHGLSWKKLKFDLSFLFFLCFLLLIFSEGGWTSVNRLTHGLIWKIDTDHMTTPIILTTNCQDYLTINYSQLQRPHWLHLLH